MKKILIFLISFFSIQSIISSEKDTIDVGYNIIKPFVFKTNNNSIEGPSVWLWEEIARENNIHYRYYELSLDNLLL